MAHMQRPASIRFLPTWALALTLIACAPVELAGVRPAPSPLAPKTMTEQSSVTTVPFTTIIQKALLGDHPTEPVYTIVALPEKWNELRERLPNAAIEVGMQASQSSDDLVIVAFAGMKGSSGYRVTVESVTLEEENDQVVISISQTTPNPDDIVEPATTLPYHLVALSRKYLQPARAMTFTFRDVKGNVLSQEDIPLY